MNSCWEKTGSRLTLSWHRTGEGDVTARDRNRREAAVDAEVAARRGLRECDGVEALGDSRWSRHSIRITAIKSIRSARKAHFSQLVLFATDSIRSVVL